MKLLLFSRGQLKHRAEELKALREAICRTGVDYAVNEEFAPILRQEAEWPIADEACYGASVGVQHKEAVMVCYGGDGTLLEGAQRLEGEPIPILGINAGHLGFLTGAPKEELNTLFEAIIDGKFSTQRRTTLWVEGNFTEQPKTKLALNEFSIQRHGAEMVSVETYVDDQMVATYHGDGVIVATPTGSTAYSLSAGGPVVAPDCGCLVITPIAPHNLTMRPVVVPDTATIRMRVKMRHSKAFATLDNNTYSTFNGAEFTIRRSEKPIFLASTHNISFYDSLRNKMMWGVDLRD